MNDLYKTVDKARDNLQQQDEVAQQRPRGPWQTRVVPRPLLLVLCAALVGVLVYMNLGNSLEEEITQDLLDAAVFLLLSADAEVTEYYAEHQALPDELPEPLVGVQVDYERQEGSRFALRVKHGPHQQIIQRDARQPLERSDILEVFGE